MSAPAPEAPSSAPARPTPGGGWLRRNRTLLIVGGVGAALGAVVLLRGGGGGSSAGSGSTVVDPMTDAAGVPYFDSTSTDVSALFGRFEETQQAQLYEYGVRLEEALEGIGGDSSPQAAPQTIPGWRIRPVTMESLPIAKLLKDYGITGREFRLANPGLYAGKPEGYQLKQLTKGTQVNLPDKKKTTK